MNDKFGPIYAAFGSGGEAANRLIHSGREPVAVTNVRYHVPTHYTVGPEFATLSEAAKYAEGLCVVPPGWAGGAGHPRQFVDRRALVTYADGSKADVVLDRIEVFDTSAFPDGPAPAPITVLA